MELSSLQIVGGFFCIVLVFILVLWLIRYTFARALGFDLWEFDLRDKGKK